MVLSQKLHEAFKGTVERITAPRTVSALKEKGVLSITEFIVAGDNLVSKCPTWSWSVPISIFNQIKSMPALFICIFGWQGIGRAKQDEVIFTPGKAVPHH